MQFKQGAEVDMADGRRVGSVDRVVMDPDTREVTHLVVRKGLFFDDDKLVPVGLIATASGERVVLNNSASDPETLPNYFEAEFIPGDVEGDIGAKGAQPLYWYPPIGSVYFGYPDLVTYTPAMPMTFTHKQNPPGTVAVREGARVLSREGKHVGNVERIIIEDTTERATHFVLSHGLLFPHKKLLPMAWVKTVAEDEIQLNVETDLLDRVGAYND